MGNLRKVWFTQSRWLRYSGEVLLGFYVIIEHPWNWRRNSTGRQWDQHLWVRMLRSQETWGHVLQKTAWEMRIILQYENNVMIRSDRIIVNWATGIRTRHKRIRMEAIKKDTTALDLTVEMALVEENDLCSWPHIFRINTLLLSLFKIK